MRIACLPLDDRPLNYAAISRAAAVSATEVLLPPRELVGGRMTAPELFPVARWLITHAEGSSLVLSLDALMHGGLVQARGARPDSPRPQEALKLLGALAHRASSASAFLVWKRVWGNIFTSRRLARLPAFQQASLALAKMTREEDVERLYIRLCAEPVAIGDLPADDVAVLARSRLRMLTEGKAVGEACAEAGISLHIAVEDSVQCGIQEEELRWLQSAAPSAEFSVADGADEVGGVLIAGTLSRISDRPPARVYKDIPLEQVAPYESRTIAENLRVLCALGHAEITQDSVYTDIRIAGAPEEGDKFADLIKGELATIDSDELLEATVSATSIQAGITCDLTATNGINASLLRAFIANTSPPVATVQMNTISNRLGHALLLATVTAEVPPTDSLATLIVENYLEDLYYQAHLRTYLVGKYGGIEPESDAMCAIAETELSAQAFALARRKFNGAKVYGKSMQVSGVDAKLPWKRWFEAEFHVEAHLE
jgi:hypothetical protein